MAEGEVRQVIISGMLVGIVGLDDVIMKTAPSLQGSTDEETQNRLLEAVSINNYIPAAALEAYRLALLREFKIAHNLPVEKDLFNGLTIAVFGAGCARCSQLESDVRDLLSEMKIAADLRHITDPKEIAHFGIMGAPVLVVNNKVVSVGEVSPKSKIRQWIIDALNQSAESNK